jgi:hypothetical protein
MKSVETKTNQGGLPAARRPLLIARCLASVACCLLLSTAADATQEQLRISVVDKATGKPLACRMHVKKQNGRPWFPKKVPAWDDHFVTTGRVTLQLPLGNYSFELERGLEYPVIRGSFSIGQNADDSQTIQLTRFTDLAAQGWWSGDLDVRRPVQDIEALMLADDLHVLPVQTWFNGHTVPGGVVPKRWSSGAPTGGRPGKEPRPSPSQGAEEGGPHWVDASGASPQKSLIRFDGNRYYQLMAGQRSGAGGTALFLNLSEPLAGQSESAEYPPIFQFMHRAKELGKPWIDATRPYWWDLPAWVANHDIDSVEVLNGNVCRNRIINEETGGRPRDPPGLGGGWGNPMWSQAVYFHLLNCGLRIPPTAGSGSGVAPNPVGSNRMYVYVEGGLDYEKWWDGLRAGRVVLTNGPLMVPRVDGELPGHVFQADRGQTLELQIALDLSIRDPDQQPIRYLEIVENGLVTRSIRFADYAESHRLPPIRVNRSGWFLIRAVAESPNTYRMAMTGPYYVEIGYQRRVSRQSAKFFLDWVYQRAKQIKIDDPDQRAEVLQYHRRARDFWQDVLTKANAD